MASLHTLSNSPIHGSPRVKVETLSPKPLHLQLADRLASRTLTPPFPAAICFRDVSPLKHIVLQQGRARYRVDLYGINHAYLTGHAGTPCRAPKSVAHTPGSPTTGKLFLRLRYRRL